MTKAENRAAAKAYRRQKLNEMANAIRAEPIEADLVELGRAPALPDLWKPDRRIASTTYHRY